MCVYYNKFHNLKLSNQVNFFQNFYIYELQVNLTHLLGKGAFSKNFSCKTKIKMIYFNFGNNNNNNNNNIYFCLMEHQTHLISFQ